VGPPSADVLPESTGSVPASASDPPPSCDPASGAPPSAGMHSTSGGAQGNPQMPILQPSPSGQTLPQEPQFLGSLPVSMQPPSQAFMPVAHPPPSVAAPSCPPPSPIVPSPVGPSLVLPPSCSGETLVFAPLAHAAARAPLRPTVTSAAQSSRHRRMRTSRSTRSRTRYHVRDHPAQLWTRVIRAFSWPGGPRGRSRRECRAPSQPPSQLTLELTRSVARPCGGGRVNSWRRRLADRRYVTRL
jgi:hypothetical protein